MYIYIHILLGGPVLLQVQVFTFLKPVACNKLDAAGWPAGLRLLYIDCPTLNDESIAL